MNLKINPLNIYSEQNSADLVKRNCFFPSVVNFLSVVLEQVFLLTNYADLSIIIFFKLDKIQNLQTLQMSSQDEKFQLVS